MSPRQASGWCVRCERQVLTIHQTSYREVFAWVFLVSVVLGLGFLRFAVAEAALLLVAPVALVGWIVASLVTRDKWRCNVCGGESLLAEDPAELARRRESTAAARATRAGKREAFAKWAYPTFALLILATLIVLMELFTRSTPG